MEWYYKSRSTDELISRPITYNKRLETVILQDLQTQCCKKTISTLLKRNYLFIDVELDVQETEAKLRSISRRKFTTIWLFD